MSWNGWAKVDDACTKMGDPKNCNVPAKELNARVIHEWAEKN
jgi:hypothetical protein